jgi:hypothetical protein
MSRSESDSGSDEEMESVVIDSRGAAIKKKKDRKTRRHILRSIRKVFKSDNFSGRTHVGKSIQRSVALAACQAPRGNRLFGGLKTSMSRVLGISTKLVTEGEALNAKFHEGSLRLEDFVKRTHNGQAIPESVCNAVRAYNLDPANTRESPNAPDQMLIWNPVSGKKDLKVSRHWLEMSLRCLHQQWLSTVRVSCAPLKITTGHLLFGKLCLPILFEMEIC